MQCTHGRPAMYIPRTATSFPTLAGRRADDARQQQPAINTTDSLHFSMRARKKRHAICGMSDAVARTETAIFKMPRHFEAKDAFDGKSASSRRYPDAFTAHGRARGRR